MTIIKNGKPVFHRLTGKFSTAAAEAAGEAARVQAQAAAIMLRQRLSDSTMATPAYAYAVRNPDQTAPDEHDNTTTT